MKNVVIFFVLYGSIVYLSINNIVNIAFVNYSLYLGIIGFCSFILFFNSLITQLRIKLSEIFLYSIPSFFILSLLISISIHGLNDFGMSLFLQFVAMCVPAYLIGSYVKKSREEKSLFKITRYLNIIVTFILFYAYLTTERDYRGYFYNFGDTSHLFIGYTSALFLIYNFIVIIYKVNKSWKYSVLNNFFTYLLMLLQFWLIIGSGSRGALIAAILTIVFASIFIKRISLKSIIGLVSILLFVFIVGFQIDESLTNGFSSFLRIFNSSDSFIDISSSNNRGRDAHYGEAIELFFQYPIFGVGALGYMSMTDFPYPHNIFLELLSNYGLLGTLPMIILILFAIKNAIKCLRFSMESGFIALIFILNIIAMQFSYSLLSNSYFWFGLGYCLANSKIINLKVETKL